ncbi:MAG: helix-turn-helix domain-containing protein [Dysgonomonas sp.]|nr:helix-turn-helix domain-containing protein [Dysgonomonas sp.]
MKDANITALPLENNFEVYRGAGNMPFGSRLSYAESGFIAFCSSGSFKITVYTAQHHITENDIVVIFPGQLVKVDEVSDDFIINYFVISPPLFNEVLSGIYRFSPLFLVHKGDKLHYRLNKSEDIARFWEFFNILERKSRSQKYLFRWEYIINLLRLFYLDMYNCYQVSLLQKAKKVDTRKEKISYDYFVLVMKYYKEKKDVAFYADKLCISAKYLTSVVKEVSGRPAKDWINEYIILDVKSLLKNSTLTVQEIAFETNFSNQAALGRFFKHHTSMTPTEYRTGKQISYSNDYRRINYDTMKESNIY